eukprot:TRINITY_DN73909_c0_g1_i1.p1 TRINITY_DN73909_c0_g1~~TRINITY_DN73909_c0_g1_i1.p1  ORF type:complete len:425 (+),score=61.32 TRINITY_DN73909_c0_g1_i1:136-1410(+)
MGRRGRRSSFGAVGQGLGEPVRAIVVERTATVCISAAAASMQGWRLTMEDEHILECSFGNQSSECHHALFAVLDGHAGPLASHLGTTILQEQLFPVVAADADLDDEAAEREIGAAFLRSDETLRDQMGGEQGGTTVAAALVTRWGPTKFRVRVANAGDSRVLLWNTDGLHCTEDHKPDSPAEKARIEAAGGGVWCGVHGGPKRVDGVLAVSRGLGDFQLKSRDPALCKVSASPDVSTYVCRSGDWLLIACDGIFDVMSNEEVHEFLDSWLDAATGSDIESAIGSAVGALVQHCLKLDSMDNCTALLVRFGPCEEHSRDRTLLSSSLRRDAPFSVREAYANFFQRYGFQQEAHAARQRQQLPSENAGAHRVWRGWDRPAASCEDSQAVKVCGSKAGGNSEDFPALAGHRQAKVRAWQAPRGRKHR